MITTPTTFVIGAGASCSYGWPSGGDLKGAASALDASSKVFQWLLQTLMTPWKNQPALDSPEAIRRINAVVADIRQSPTRSIDQYLEKRQSDPHAMRIGRLLIAILLAEWPTRQHSGPSQDDWLDEVFYHLQRGAPTAATFKQKNAAVRFVTFNFDSIIEERLAVDLRRTFPDQLPNGSFGLAPVIHVHGRLPPFPTESLRGNNFSEFPPAWLVWPHEAASRINVVLDTIDEKVLSDARAAIEQSSVICFLGFGFETTNVQRIGLTTAAVEKRKGTLSLYGSSSGLQAADRLRAEFLLPGLKLVDDAKCLPTLRSVHVFRD